MKNRTIKPLWVIVALLGIVPIVCLILSVFYRDLAAFYVALLTIELPIFVTFLILVLFNVILYFRDKRAIHRKNENPN